MERMSVKPAARTTSPTQTAIFVLVVMRPTAKARRSHTGKQAVLWRARLKRRRKAWIAAIARPYARSIAVLGNKKRFEPALSFASCNPAVVVRSEQLDADPLLIGVENGVISLRDGSFQPHRREHLVTRRAFLQRLAGYSLTGEMREHVLPFHFGHSANGKRTFLEEALLGI